MKKIWTILILVLIAADVFAFLYWFRWRKEARIDRYVQAAASAYDVRPSLIKAIIWRESRFNIAARGGAGEIGLMQIRDLAAQEWATAEDIYPFHHENIIHPGTNTLAGTWYIRKLMERYKHTDNCLPYALADYNAGRSNVLKWMKGKATTNSVVFTAQIGFPSTHDYVQSVSRKYAEYFEEMQK
ncbi:lytic transglycosylase domain-containing protein [Verrucomicrobia bacterium]|nr:lytic transglycosylase domain-containing protein [Verrucomicrobiota bacterium]